MRSAIRPAAERRGLPRAVRRACSPPPGGGCGLHALTCDLYFYAFTRAFADEAAGCHSFAMTETPHPNTKLRASTARRTRRSRTPPKPAAQTEVRRRRQEACRACGRDLPSAAGGGGERHAHACDLRAAACKACCERRRKAGLKPGETAARPCFAMTAPIQMQNCVPPLLHRPGLRPSRTKKPCLR